MAVPRRGDRSVLEVELVTGRKHQIRRHCADSGFPVLGDPVYGKNNKDARRLQLFGVALEFECPLKNCGRSYRWQPQDAAARDSKPG